MATKHEVEAIFKLKDEMSVQLQAIQKRAAALEKEAKGLIGGTKNLQSTFDQATKGLEKFSPGLGQAVSKVTDLTKGLSPLGIGIGVVAGGMAAALSITAKWTAEIVEVSSKLTDLSAKTSLSTDSLQELGHAGSLVGIDINQIAAASTNLERRLGAGVTDAQKAMERLGLSTRELLSLNPDERFRKVAEAIRTLVPESQQAAVAFQAFGRSGTELLPLIRSNIEGAVEEFRALGGAIDADVVAAGERLGDQMTLLGAAFTGFKGQIAGDVIPVLSELAQAFIDLTKFMQESKEETKDNQFVKFFDDIQKSANPVAGSIIQLRAALRAFTEGRALNQLAAEGAAAGLSSIPKPPGAPAGPPRPPGIGASLLGVTESGGVDTKELLRIEKEQANALRIIEIRNKAAEDAAKAHAKELKDLALGYESAMRAGREFAASLHGQTDALADLDAEIQSADFGAEIGAHLEEAQKRQAEALIELERQKMLQDEINASRDAGIVPLDLTGERTRELSEAQQDYNQALGAANDIAQLLGGTIGSILGQTLALTAGLTNISKVGLGGLFEQGKGDATGILGLIGGIGGIASGIGAVAGPVIAGLKALFSLGGPDIGRDVGRDIGVGISEELEKAIEESGQNAQLFLREIFAEGDLGIDELAREVGDLFSMFERGDISETGLIGELKETLPILIANMKELGPAGEAEITRITEAAKRLGISIEEIDALVQSTFAPETMEEIAAGFGLTNDQVRELGELLNVDIQTDLERMAATLGLTVEEFNALGAAVSEKFGIPAEQIDELLASMGVSAEELAAALGVDVGAAAGGLTEETAAANAELGIGVELSGLLAFNLERAAAFAGGIRIPSFDSGGGIPETGARHGFHGDVTGPRRFVIEPGVRERVDIGPAGSGKTAGVSLTIVNHGTLIGSSAEFEEAVARAVTRATKPTNNTGGANSALRRNLR